MKTDEPCNSFHFWYGKYIFLLIRDLDLEILWLEYFQGCSNTSFTLLQTYHVYTSFVFSVASDRETWAAAIKVTCCHCETKRNVGLNPTLRYLIRWVNSDTQR